MVCFKSDVIFLFDNLLDVGDDELAELISGVNVTERFFLADKNCPIDWEPSGSDFLSPCLQVCIVVCNQYSVFETD